MRRIGDARPTTRRTIFVFASNTEGRHGAGTALYAWKYRGAIKGQKEGRQGESYAIVTKELRKWKPKVNLLDIMVGVTRFLDYAIDHPDVDFQVTSIGCGLAGFTPLEIAPLFKGHTDNVKLPVTFRKVLGTFKGYVK